MPPDSISLDTGSLATAVATLATLVTHEFLVDDLLGQLCRIAADTLHVDGAGVMSYDRGRSRFVAASGPATAAVELVQERMRSGPCWDAVRSRGPVAVASLPEMSARWPLFADAAREAGIGSVLVVPLVSRGRSWGCLDLYRSRERSWDNARVHAAQLLADVAVSYLVMAADRDDARAAQQELAGRALHDPLTGLPNRELMFELISHALASADRQGTAAAVLFIDLDHFKAVNDTFGHQAGDLVLQTVSQRMAAVLRASDTLGRLAGDEFLVVCEGFSDPAGAGAEFTLTNVAERLRSVINIPIGLTGAEIRITASIGAVITTDGPAATDLVHDADIAMYEAKSAGRDRVVIHHPATGDSLTRRRELDRGLHHVVDREQLELYYQPIINTRGQVTAAEALVRWHHPQHGLIPAAEFIDLAHANGTIVGIGSWVIQQACRQLRFWREINRDTAPELIFCNISPLELSSAELPTVIDDCLRENLLQPSDLGFEILEADFAHRPLVELLNGLQELGHPLAIDDFGTGYSSLARLIELPLNYLKIDRSFVNKLPTDPRSRGMVAAISNIARELDITIIAEGIETADQAAFLVDAGCQLLQGYYVGIPQPARELEQLIHSDRGSER